MRVVDLEVCEDCIMWIANGDGTPAHVRKMQIWWPVEDGWELSAGNSVDNSDGDEFSWATCDGCGSTTGGARFPAAAIQL